MLQRLVDVLRRKIADYSNSSVYIPPEEYLDFEETNHEKCAIRVMRLIDAVG
jgi:hypothetical protein